MKNTGSVQSVTQRLRESRRRDAKNDTQISQRSEPANAGRDGAVQKVHGEDPSSGEDGPLSVHARMLRRCKLRTVCLGQSSHPV